jgi:RsiW-degrading membrane proteinase PrsW (M82 family)
MFSGLGFAAFENMDYGQMAVGRSYSLAMTYGAHGLQAGVEGAMISVMLRSLSLVFCHAVWSGTFSYFLAIAVATRRRLGALLVVGLGVSAVLHGSYDWFCEVQPTLAAGIAGLSIVLLYGYVSKIRGNTRRVGDHAQEGV